MGLLKNRLQCCTSIAWNCFGSRLFNSLLGFVLAQVGSRGDGAERSREKNGKKGAGASKKAQKINKATPKAVAKAAPKGAAKAAPKGAAKAAPKENTASIEENTSDSEIVAVVSNDSTMSTPNEKKIVMISLMRQVR